jgi:hypothetical protein
LNRSQVNCFENAKLEEKIKELQLNLASLPSSFSRPKSKSNYQGTQQQHLLSSLKEPTPGSLAVEADRHQRDGSGSGQRIHSECDGMGSTLSTSPDKKSFDNRAE